jgi:hypothetical protein
MKTCCVAATLTALLLASTTAQAQLPRFDRPSDFDPFNRNSGINQLGRQIDQARLDAMSRTPRAGRDYTRLHVRNDSAVTIWVAVRFMPFRYDDGRTSNLEFVGSQPAWITRAWFKLAPGQDAYVGDTNNLIYYVYAKSDDGRRVWSGNHPVNVSGQHGQLGFRQEYIGIGTPADWTLRLNGR